MKRDLYGAGRPRKSGPGLVRVIRAFPVFRFARRVGLGIVLLGVVGGFVVLAAGSGPAMAAPFAFGLHVQEPDGVLPLHARIAAGTGAEAVPVYFAWDAVEPNPGRFVLAAQEAFAAAAKARGLRIVGVLVYPEHLPLPTASMSRTGWPSGHVDDWTFFVSHVVGRFRDRVDGWIIDGGARHRGTGLFAAAKAEGYAAFVRITAGVLRRTDPDPPVLAVVPGSDVLWLQNFGHYGGLAPLDGLALDVNRWPTAPSGLGVVLAEVREVARLFGEMPALWAWQLGYPTHRATATSMWAGVAPETQAVYGVQSHVRLLAAGAEAVFWHELLDQGPRAEEPGDNFGLYTWELAEKPWARAYRTLTRLLRGLHYARAGDVISRPVLPPPEVSVPGEPAPGEPMSGEPAPGEPEKPDAAGASFAKAFDAFDDGPFPDPDDPSFHKGSDGLPYHFIFDYGLLKAVTAAAGGGADDRGLVPVAHVFTGSRGTVVVLWAEPPVAADGRCRDGCGQVSILPWLDGVPVRAYDVYGEPLERQEQWAPGREPMYIELPMELVPR